MTGDEPGGLCSACLLQVGFESQTDSESESVSPPAEQAPTDSNGNAPAKPSDPVADLSLAEVQSLFADLEITELIGRGGMGMVYKARQTHLGRVVALKLLRTKCSQDPSLAERFGREARALARLSHPNIVGVHDFGQAGDRLYLIMEYVDGTNLRRMLAQKTLTAKAALAMVSPICDALQFAHEEGIVHRDIKPENILIDRRGRVRIADFGLARLLVRGQDEWTLTGTRQVMGTPHYMAPEQMERPQEVDHRADIFSLGVVIYEMLTGELPLGRFDLPSQKLDIDVRLDKIVLRTLEKEPSRRYQHVSDVQTDVEQLSAQANSQTENSRLDFTRPSIYIPACGFILAAAIDLLVGLFFGSIFLFDNPREDNFLVAAAHILAAFPLGFGGWKMVTRGGREWTWLVALFGLLPLHFGAWFSVPCAIWTLYLLLGGSAPRVLTGPTSSHDLDRTGERLAMGIERLQAVGGRTVEVTQSVLGNAFSFLGRFPWTPIKRIVRGIAACLIWLAVCAATVGLLFYMGAYDHFPSTAVVADHSADQVKLKADNDLYLDTGDNLNLYLAITAVGMNENASGFSRLPKESWNYNLQLSIYRLADKDLRLSRDSQNIRSFVRPRSSREVYSNQSFVAWMNARKEWEYEIIEALDPSRIQVEPHVLLTDDLESLNLDAMASPPMAMFSSTNALPVSLFTTDRYEYHPVLNDAQPLIDWFRATGLEEARCVVLGTSLSDMLTKLKNGDSVTVAADGTHRLKPIAALLDLRIFQPQGNGRLQIQWIPNRQELIKWCVATGCVALVGCVIIIWWMRRASLKSNLSSQ